MRPLFTLCLIFYITTVAQGQIQVGVFGGLSNYLGDLTDKVYQNSRAVGGIHLGYQISPRLNLRAGLNIARVVGADSLTNQDSRRLRNLDFQSNITELSVVAELNTFDMDIKSWSPYIFGGLAFFHFNPYTYDTRGLKVMLQPLGTEGQGLPGYQQTRLYSLTRLAIPFGGGVKYKISDNVRIALEVGLRKLFTDYLDDVSTSYADPVELLTVRGQESVDLAYRTDELPGGDPFYPPKGLERGSPKNKDYYYFSGLHLTFQLGDNEGASYSGRGRKRSYGCPTVF